MDEEPASELLVAADRDRRQPALAKQPLAILADQVLHSPHNGGWLGWRRALAP
jgi:hypothetical protein